MMPKLREYSLAFHQGGLGDVIGQLPAVKYILDFHPHISINMFAHNYAIDLCKKAFTGYDNIQFFKMEDIESSGKKDLLLRSPYVHKITNLASHIVDHAFTTLLNTSVEDKYKNYLKIDPINIHRLKLPKDYAVITTGFTSDTREWLPEYVNGVSEWLVSKGITPVYIGKKYTQAHHNIGITGNFKANYSNGVNLIDKTNLFEAHSIMHNAQAVLGLDNGLIHLAGMSDKAKIVAGFTTVDPKHRLPYRNDILGWNCFTVTPDVEKLPCTYCQSNMSFADSSHSFTNCYYGDFECLKHMTTDKWIAQLEKALES
jgi:hypothetical protein